MQNLTERVEKDLAKELPKKFGFVFDRWSDTSTHYMAIYEADADLEPTIPSASETMQSQNTFEHLEISKMLKRKCHVRRDPYLA